MTYKEKLKLIEGIANLGENVCTDVGMDIYRKRPVSEREKELYDLFIQVYEIAHWSLSKCCKSKKHDLEMEKRYKKLVKKGYCR